MGSAVPWAPAATWVNVSQSSAKNTLVRALELDVADTQAKGAAGYIPSRAVPAQAEVPILTDKRVRAGKAHPCLSLRVLL